MKIAVLIISMPLVAAGCVSSQFGMDQENRGGETTERVQEKAAIGNPVSKFSMQIGAPECDVR